MSDKERGLGGKKVVLHPEARDFLSEICDGDARHALSALELAFLSTAPSNDGIVHITLDVMQDCIQRRQVQYDKNEEGHYDTISAFIKSIRGSDPDAAIYWLAKMLEAGEDPRFIARRIVISASEDIGNADPRGLTLAVSALNAVEFVGMPEARIALAQAVTYLATAPKSNAAYMALEKAAADIKSGAVQPVPEHIKNVHIKAVGASTDTEYKYPHDYPDTYVDQTYLTIPKTYYKPKNSGYEQTIAQRLEFFKSKRAKPS
jgi:putative ATPase